MINDDLCKQTSAQRTILPALTVMKDVDKCGCITIRHKWLHNRLQYTTSRKVTNTTPTDTIKTTDRRKKSEQLYT